MLGVSQKDQAAQGNTSLIFYSKVYAAISGTQQTPKNLYVSVLWWLQVLDYNIYM